jgi:GTP cyclohydrolase II
VSRPSAFGLDVAIVISEFNLVIAESLLSGAIDAYTTGGGKEENIKIYRVPGAYEIPGTVKQVLANKSLDAVVTLGAVIRGETPHFDYVAGECARGISELSMAHDIPIMFGVLTTDNLQQEGRGIGLKNKIRAYQLQDDGLDTVEANEKLGYAADLREYGIGAQILKKCGVQKMRLLTNNPQKIVGVEGHGLEVVGREALEIKVNHVNEKYLKTKRDKLGHFILGEE